LQSQLSIHLQEYVNPKEEEDKEEYLKISIMKGKKYRPKKEIQYRENIT
jgi:hypothetical protein